MSRKLTTLALSFLALGIGGCGGREGDEDSLRPEDGGAATGDGGAAPDGGTSTGTGPAGAACTMDSQCAGGTCLGDADGPETGNPRFAGGYCTALGCVADSQDGCGPDEWCIDVGFSTMCVEECSKAMGNECERADHVCLGIGTRGGCFSERAVECTVGDDATCGPGELCVRIGFEDATLGRCETRCDPMNDTTCSDSQACYYIRRYNAAFCNSPGTSMPEESCACDKCCVPDHACTPDLDGLGRHCKRYCAVAEGCPDGSACVPLESGSPWGGCVAPGSAGT